MTSYAYGATWNDQTAYNRGRLGDATSEIVIDGGSNGWYGDYGYIVYTAGYWIHRGGKTSNNNGAGLFNFNYTVGSSNSSRGTRAALVAFP